MKWDEGMDWIDLAEDKDKWGGVVAKPVMNFRVQKNAGNLLTWQGVLAARERPFCIKLVRKSTCY